MKKHFSPEYRPLPFWSWNDRLEIPELLRQIREMHAAGIGGFFMHARSGLRTEYFSKEWFAAVRACIEEAERLGMEPWLYDENGWPSGFGNGGVNGLGEKYQQKYLRITSGEAPHNPICKTGGFTFYYNINPYYVDTLDADVTNEFIRQVYQRYKETLLPDLWAHVKGFFTDEPQISRDGIPWSLTLPAEYRAAYQRDLLEELPGLFHETPGYQAVRIRFWSLVTRLFRDHFFKPIYDWCEANGIMLTGHQLLEETYYTQLVTNGAVMPQYQYYHIPGVDWTSRSAPNPVLLNQLCSAAAQTGKKRLLAETFACSGWNVSFQHLKWIYQLQMVRGINVLCQHLESYSLRGLRKRDYPASLFVHLPWWKEYHRFNERISRIGQLLAEGESVCHVLILHGQSSAWIAYNDSGEGALDHHIGERTGYQASGNRILDHYSTAFSALTRELEKRQILFHYGDETIIEECGGVDDAVLTVGIQNYTAVILPQLCNISAKEKTLLMEFVRNGGQLYGIRDQLEQPFTVDGETDDTLHGLLRQCRWFNSESGLAEVLKEKYAICRLEGESDEIVATCRHYADWDGEPVDILYLVNQNKEKSAHVRLVTPGIPIACFDSESIDLVPLSASSAERDHTFAPGDDLLLAVRSRRDSGIYKPDSSFSVKYLTPNLLTLDHCRCYVNGQLLSEKMETISLMTELLKSEQAAGVRLEFDFSVSEEYHCERPLHLVMEDPERFRIFLNGEAVLAKPDGMLFDQAFQYIALPQCRKGNNRIALETEFRQSPKIYEMLRRGHCCESEGNKLFFDMELESVYLAGEFAVQNQGKTEFLPDNLERMSGPFVITEAQNTVSIENIQRDGLPFFAGRILLFQEFDLEFTDYSALCCREMCAGAAKFRLNGVSLETMLWKPYRIAIPESLLKKEKNLLVIELISGLANLLGPHHLENNSGGVGPLSFFRYDDYLGRKVPVWNENYTIHCFGLKGLTLNV